MEDELAPAVSTYTPSRQIAWKLGASFRSLETRCTTFVHDSEMRLRCYSVNGGHDSTVTQRGRARGEARRLFEACIVRPNPILMPHDSTGARVAACGFAIGLLTGSCRGSHDGTPDAGLSAAVDAGSCSPLDSAPLARTWLGTSDSRDDRTNARDASPFPPGAPERAWLLRGVRFPVATDALRLGADIDGHETRDESDPEGCGWSDLERSGGSILGDHIGIDAQLNELLSRVHQLGVIWELEQAANFATVFREWVLLLRIRVGDDGRVEAQIFEGRLADGINLPTEAMGWPALHPNLELARGRTVALEDASLYGGRLVANAPLVEIAHPTTNGVALELRIRDFQIDTRLSSDAAEIGMIGGYVTVNDLISGSQDALAAADVRVPVETVRSVVEGHADLHTTDCECDALSVSLTFETIPATVGPASAPGI